MSDLVSIIIPVFNMETSLKKSTESIINQDYSNIEVILVDDGSQDNSYQVCKEMALRDSRIVCIHTENHGSGPARNEGIKVSKGRYLYFPDADDYLDTHAISTLVSAMCEGQFDLVVFGYKCTNHEGNIIFEKKYEPNENTGDKIRAEYSKYFGMSSENSIQGAPWNKFFDGNVVRKYAIEYPALRRHQDEGFISRYVTHCSNVKFISSVLYTYFQNTVRLEWRKYPVDYIDVVIGLNKVWRETICSWNVNSEIANRLVDEEILTKILKALELSYSPKMKLNLFTRPKWIKNACEKSGIAKYNYDIAGSLYQKFVLFSCKSHMYALTTLALFVGNIKNQIRQG